MSEPIRVAVANRPRLMRELMVATMMDQPDIEVVAEIQDESAIPRVLEQLTPEFLIVALDSPGQRPSLCTSVLTQFPKTKILALASDGSWSVFYWASFEIHATSVEASESGILKALRSSAQVSGRESR